MPLYQRHAPQSCSFCSGSSVMTRVQVRIVIYRFGQRAEPFVPVQPGGNFLSGQGIGGGGASHVHLDQLDAPQLAFADQVGRMDEFGIGPLLASHLQYPAVFAHGLAQLLSLVYGQRQRLFEVDVLAGPAGCDRDQRVLVVGCRDHDGVDVVPREQVLIILVQVDLAFLPVLGVIFLHALLEAGSFDVVDVASCQHADAVDRKEARQQVHRLLTETDEADADRIVGRAFLFRGFRGGCQSRRHQYGSCGSQRRDFQKVAAGQFGFLIHIVQIGITVLSAQVSNSDREFKMISPPGGGLLHECFLFAIFIRVSGEDFPCAAR